MAISNERILGIDGNDVLLPLKNIGKLPEATAASA
ncbi:MAG: hypothetical protein ABTS16_10825 [Candidatus Accumulibacter phosphatis]